MEAFCCPARNGPKMDLRRVILSTFLSLAQNCLKMDLRRVKETIEELQEAIAELEESILELQEAIVSSRGPRWGPKERIQKVLFSL